MRKETKEKLESMKGEDFYSLVLFALFNLQKIPEYSAISELAYILDGKNLFNLLEYFGGTTLRVPTLKDIRTVLYAMLLFQFVELEGIEYPEAIKLLNVKDCSLKDVKDCYYKVADVLREYKLGEERQ